jgi:hypothetical protein
MWPSGWADTARTVNPVRAHGRLGQKVFKRLVTNCHQTEPEHESQVRPLIGLTPDQAGVVWEAAVAKAGSRRITAAIVKSAMHHLKIGPARQPAAPAARQNMAEQRQAIDTVLGELLFLASQQADHRLITAKLEALNSHIHKSLFPRGSETAASLRPKSDAVERVPTDYCKA